MPVCWALDEKGERKAKTGKRAKRIRITNILNLQYRKKKGAPRDAFAKIEEFDNVHHPMPCVNLFKGLLSRTSRMPMPTVINPIWV